MTHQEYIELLTTNLTVSVSAEIALKKETEKIKGLRNDLVFLRNVMRIYLKIEWNKAKIGA